MSEQQSPEKAFPWAIAMQFGLGRLRLPPDQFWSMTPQELAAAIEAFNGGTSDSLSRNSLKDMMQQFPDISDG
jgi:uncharacterized phage protein (TIGR02216 family)